MFRFFIAAAIGMMAALPVAAQTLERTPNAVASIGREFGSAFVDQVQPGDLPSVSGTIDGVNYAILFYGCEAGDVGCDSLQFFASFDAPDNSLDFVNQWNFDRRFAAVYRRTDGVLVINYNVNIDFGVTQQNFRDTYDIWSILLTEFADRVFGPSTGGGGTSPGK
ncbi:MAG: YbjN domain-containing protein [Pseudomonadota bacterium]